MKKVMKKDIVFAMNKEGKTIYEIQKVVGGKHNSIYGLLSGYGVSKSHPYECKRKKVIRASCANARVEISWIPKTFDQSSKNVVRLNKKLAKTMVKLVDKVLKGEALI